jgi:hypothetical protein
MDSPFSMFKVNYLRTSTNTPFYLSIVSLSIQTSPPYGVSCIAFKISSLSLGSSYNSSSRLRYRGGGALISKGYLLSTKEFLGTDSVIDHIFGF